MDRGQKRILDPSAKDEVMKRWTCLKNESGMISKCGFMA